LSWHRKLDSVNVVVQDARTHYHARLFTAGEGGAKCPPNMAASQAQFRLPAVQVNSNKRIPRNRISTSRRIRSLPRSLAGLSW